MAKEMINVQPQGMPPMIAGGNRNAMNRLIGGDGQRDWSYGLCDCFSACGLCCCSVWCPCVVYSKSKQRLHHLQGRGTPLPGGGDACDGTCCLYACLGFFGYAWIMQISTRSTTRARYNIRGGALSDCCASLCCSACALTQERREIELEETTFQGYSQGYSR